MKPYKNPALLLFSFLLLLLYLAMSTFLFSSLPSTALLHKTPNSSPLLCNFSPYPASFSFSFSTKTKPFPLRHFSFTASAVGFQVPTETNCSDATTTAEQLDISKLGISEEIVSALARRGITELFPIQVPFFRLPLEPKVVEEAFFNC